MDTAPAPSLPRRARLRLVLWALAVIAAGLATRADLPLPEVVRVYGGDTLYAVLIFVLVAWIVPTGRSARLTMAAAAVCGLIEVSQLWHPPWLDAIRLTRPGALVLGRGFVWTDLICYLVGAIFAGGLDACLQRRGMLSQARVMQEERGKRTPLSGDVP